MLAGIEKILAYNSMLKRQMILLALLLAIVLVIGVSELSLSLSLSTNFLFGKLTLKNSYYYHFAGQKLLYFQGQKEELDLVQMEEFDLAFTI